jgi:hypothetical protein
MLIDSFVNREAELEYLSKDIERYYESKKVYILSAPSGVGKSLFAEKLLYEIHDTYQSIKVSFVQNMSDYKSEGYYLKIIAREINELARKTESFKSYQQYISDFVKKNKFKDIVNELVKALPYGETAINIKKALLEDPDFSSENIFNSSSSIISPQTNGICERFNKTILDEFYKVAFRKKIYHSIEELQIDLDEWLHKYNYDRTHQGKRCQGRTPMETFAENLSLAKEKILGMNREELTLIS